MDQTKVEIQSELIQSLMETRHTTKNLLSFADEMISLIFVFRQPDHRCCSWFS